MKTVYKYIAEGSYTGIVVSDTKEEAYRRVKEMLEDYDAEDDDLNNLKVFKIEDDENYSSDYPDILEF